MMLFDILEIQKKNSNGIYFKDDFIAYSQLYLQAEQLSLKIENAIANLPNENVLMCFPNSIGYAIAYFAIQKAGKIVVPIGVNTTDKEIISTIKYCEIYLVLTDASHIDMLTKSFANVNLPICLIDIDSGTTFYFNNDNIEYYHKFDQNKKNENDVAVMLHTSGTTSDPKRVMLTHRNILTNIKSNILSLKLTADDIGLIAMPMYFGYSHTAQFLTHVNLGASIVVYDGMFLPKKFFELVEKFSVTNFTAVPTMLLILLDFAYNNKYNYKSLKKICFGGGIMPREKLKLLIDKFYTVEFIQTYGQTEASPRLTALLGNDSVRKLGSVGKAIPGVIVNVVSETKKECCSCEIGEIIAKGENIMKGYYKHEETTRNTIQDSWLRTGDLGYIDDEGYLFLTGRKKNVIISGGINIYPEEIEEVLLENEHISEAYVFAELHDLLGEIVVAKIILKDNLSIDDIKIFCSNALSDYKVPKKILIVDKLEKTYNGKQLRRK